MILTFFSYPLSHRRFRGGRVRPEHVPDAGHPVLGLGLGRAGQDQALGAAVDGKGEVVGPEMGVKTSFSQKT